MMIRLIKLCMRHIFHRVQYWSHKTSVVLKHEEFNEPIVPIMIRAYIIDPSHYLTQPKESLLWHEFYLWNYALNLHFNFTWIFYNIGLGPIWLSEKI